MYIFFDTETTGLPKNYKAPASDTDNWPRLVQIAWQIYDDKGVLVKTVNRIIKPSGFIIPDDSIRIHRITNERANSEGIDLKAALIEFENDFTNSKYLIAHNISFDEKIVGAELYRLGIEDYLKTLLHIDTKDLTVDFCKLPGKGGRYKWPTLTELHNKLFGVGFSDAHDAIIDVEALARCFFKLQELGIFGFKAQDEIKDDDSVFHQILNKKQDTQELVSLSPFASIGIHTFYSILEGAGTVDEYITLAKQYNITSLAITDINTLSGTFEFYKKCKDRGIKPVFGIEMFINDSIEKSNSVFDNEDYKIKIFIKNKEGYKNLNKLLYLANTKGFYNEKSKICESWLFENKEGLIISTSSIESKFASLVLKGKETEAETLLSKYYYHFNNDLICELQFSDFQTQKTYNNFLIKMVNKYSLLPVVSNNTYYPKKEDDRLQDILASIKQNRPIHATKLKDDRNLYLFSRNDFFKKNKELAFNYPDEFIDLCLDNTLKVSELCNYDFEIGTEKYPKYEPTKDVIDFFKTSDIKEIITKLSFAKLQEKLKKYKKNGLVEITSEKIQEYYDRLNYEIKVIEDKSMLDYFMVNWELICDYRKKGYVVGPARGSAAGSLLSWCLDITKIDPLRFGLYFERFLNPTRKGAPDIDIDYMTDTDHITNDFLIRKYGQERVIPVGTFSTFNEKGCLKDVVRALKGQAEAGMESDVSAVTKEMPNFLKYEETVDFWFKNWANDPNCSQRVKDWLHNPENKEIIEITLRLQKKIRGIGKHAAGIVITPSASWEYIPTNIIPTNGTVVTAFQEADKSGKDLSELGVLKLDRLKLETLNVIEDSIKLIQEKTGIDVRDNIDYVDLSDENLFHELRLGLNHGIFQFESPGMNNLITGIHIEKFDELVAANALYRPGPMKIGAHEEYIQNKFNPSLIKYIHPSLESILSTTNGVLIFQEQLMFIGQKIGGMSLGEGDMLRRYMDKASKAIIKKINGVILDDEETKNYKEFDKYWNKFLDGAEKNGFKKEEIDIIKNWVSKYIGYSFNLSHSLSYSYLAMQTLYLKHYYPTEFYTALLNHAKTGGGKEEQKAWIAAAIASAMSKNITIKPPSRKSGWNWTMTGPNEISMGFSGINGLGDIAYEELMAMIKKIDKTFDTITMTEFFSLEFSKFSKGAFEACLKAGVFDDWSNSREYLKELKAKKRKKQPANQMALFDLAGPEFDIKLISNNCEDTTELEKDKGFLSVCNFDLKKIKWITDVKKRINSNLTKRKDPIESIINFEKDDWYFFFVEDIELMISKKGSQYIKMKVGDGISSIYIRLFGDVAKNINNIISKNSIYISQFEKKNNFINMKKDTIIKKIE